jgi:hypothetical protein
VFNDHVALAIGARSQSARTYLEKNAEEFDSCKISISLSAFSFF